MTLVHSGQGPHTHRATEGPVQILCKEIGFPFDHRLEREDVLVGFARELLYEVSRENGLSRQLAEMVGKAHNADALEAINLAVEMLGADDKVAAAARVHDACHRLNPEDACPTNHAIDMVASIASAVRFGLEKPCRSRHAASAAQHVWKHTYGVSRFDSHTPAWEKEWSRSKLQAAIISLLPPEATTASSVGTQAEGRSEPPIRGGGTVSDDYEDDDREGVPCPRCNGDGTVDCYCGGDLCVCDNYGERDCPTCYGEGEVTEEREATYFENQRKAHEAMRALWEKSNG